MSNLLFFSMIFAVNASKAQTFSLKVASSKDYKAYAFSSVTADTTPKFPLRLIPLNFYSKNMGFFCKKELQLETRIKLPLKFRLGSMDYNNWMEAKPNSGLLRP